MKEVLHHYDTKLPKMICKNLLLLAVLILISTLAFSQNLQKNKFIVITFEVNNDNKHVIRVREYSWVVPVDSIKSYENILYPLYVSAYTKKQFNDCNAGTSIDPTFKPGESGFNYTWDDAHDKLYELIKKERKLIQTIKKTWSADGTEEVIKIYATPIIGEFCSCELSTAGQKRNGYKGNIFLAWNFSESYPEFWNSGLEHSILKQDYSQHEFWKSQIRME